MLDEGNGRAPVALFFYIVSLAVVLLGLCFVGRWPSCLGNGDEECRTCVARKTGRGGGRPKMIADEEKELLSESVSSAGCSHCLGLC